MVEWLHLNSQLHPGYLRTILIPVKLHKYHLLSFYAGFAVCCWINPLSSDVIDCHCADKELRFIGKSW
jgi:hypothetical protein